MPKVTKDERDSSIATLRDWLKPGQTIHCLVTHVSRSGLQRNIKALAIEPDPSSKDGINSYNLAWHISRALDWGYDDTDDTVRVSGAGMDMGWHMVDCLSRTLYPNAGPDDKLVCRWL